MAACLMVRMGESAATAVESFDAVRGYHGYGLRIRPTLTLTTHHPRPCETVCRPTPNTATARTQAISTCRLFFVSPLPLTHGKRSLLC